jgi:hypothetical protein
LRIPDAHRYWILSIYFQCYANADTELHPIHGFCTFSLEHQQGDNDRWTGGFCGRNNYGALKLTLRFCLNALADMFVRLLDFIPMGKLDILFSERGVVNRLFGYVVTIVWTGLHG